MGRKKPNKSLLQQCKERLDSKLAIGESKALAKRDGTYTSKIYSWKTYRTYLAESIRFVQWCKEQPPHPSIGHKPRTLEECKVYVEDYLTYNINRSLSPWTLHTQANSIAKLMGCSTSDFNIKLPIRKRGIITRSRGIKVRDKNYSEKSNQDVILLNRVVGMRRSELAQVRGSDLMFIDGNPYIKISRGTKGGKIRYSELAGSPAEIQKVVEMFQSAGKNKLIPHPNSNIDFHGLRREYAKSLYSKYSTDYNEYSKRRLLVFKHKIIGSYTTKNGRKSIKEFNRLCKELNISPNEKGLRDASGVYHCRNDLKTYIFQEKFYILSVQTSGIIEVMFRFFIYIRPKFKFTKY